MEVHKFKILFLTFHSSRAVCCPEHRVILQTLLRVHILFLGMSTNISSLIPLRIPKEAMVAVHIRPMLQRRSVHQALSNLSFQSPHPLRCNSCNQLSQALARVQRMVMLTRTKDINQLFNLLQTFFFKYSSSNKEILRLHKALAIINENCFMSGMFKCKMAIQYIFLTNYLGPYNPCRDADLRCNSESEPEEKKRVAKSKCNFFTLGMQVLYCAYFRWPNEEGHQKEKTLLVLISFLYKNFLLFSFPIPIDKWANDLSILQSEN
ncbi:hypothetical protein MKW94_000551 [Papaver nudicaule]|uniref:Uncharacterized protein n=1 Tax=Papaver nudicaule TaxID=74823 RepID=A0AA41VVB9_PAPNU|nr:hypothetical protein [Papaver nudicaule]